jgi:hypothetical protein
MLAAICWCRLSGRDVDMEEPQTWRELLGRVTGDPQERQRIADAVGVNAVTLMRWATCKSNPRPDNLRPLVEALPQYRRQLVELIEEEYPHIFAEDAVTKRISLEISSAFYARVLSAHTTTPAVLRESTICDLVLQQILEHLDPQFKGITIIVAQCTTPSPGQKVRSLRRTFGRASPPWNIYIEHQTQFVGAESQMGYAMMTGHFIAVQSHEERMRTYPSHQSEEMESYAAFPILLADHVAGCLGVASTMPYYFTLERLDLLQRYADLLVLAFEHDKFYALSDIELGIMPDHRLQQRLIAGFQQRVSQHMIRASRQGQRLTRPQAEAVVWHELEGELLDLQLEPHRQGDQGILLA